MPIFMTMVSQGASVGQEGSLHFLAWGLFAAGFILLATAAWMVFRAPGLRARRCEYLHRP